MKKFFAILLCAIMLVALVACDTGAKEADYKLGMGVVVSMDSSKDGLAQVDATVATVVTDAEGKIVACRIDVAQNKYTLGTDKADKKFETKMELGSRYGMEGKVDNDGNGVKLEWDAQAKVFEAWVVGKTANEVKATELQEANGHQIAVDKDLLDAGCSMQITDFIAAVVKACNDEQGMAFKTAGEMTLGVAAKTTAAETTDTVVKMYTDFAAAVVVDGKIVAALNDAIQPNITVDAEGKIVDKTLQGGTKRERKEGYGMAPVKIDNDKNGVTKEWFEQSAAFSNFVVGKTAAEVAGLQTQEAGGHQIAVDKALLDAGCSIQITAIKAVVAQAANNAR